MAGNSSVMIIVLLLVFMLCCGAAGVAYYEGWTCSVGFGNSCSSSSSTPSTPGPSTPGGAGSSGSPTPSGPPVPNKQHLKNGNGTCAISDATMGVGSAIYNYTCPTTGTGTVNEQWVYTPVGQLLDYQTFGTTKQLCANIPGAQATAGAVVSLYDCEADVSSSAGGAGVSNDQWDFDSQGRITARMAPTMCLDSGTGVTPTPITLQPCSAAQSQIFSVIP